MLLCSLQACQSWRVVNLLCTHCALQAPTLATPEQTGPTLASGGTDGAIQLAVGGTQSPPMDKQQSLVVFNEDASRTFVPLPAPELPEIVLQSMAGILVIGGN